MFILFSTSSYFHYFLYSFHRQSQWNPAFSEGLMVVLI